VMNHLDSMDPSSGLYPLLNNISSGQAHNGDIYGVTYTVGASADSFYEYQLKVWLQSNKTDEQARLWYDESVSGIVDYLLMLSEPSKNLYVAQFTPSQNQSQVMDHLSCFLPGMLALGAHGEHQARDLYIASELMKTCFDMYSCTATGLAPESIRFKPGMDFLIENPRYMLRPETMESLFILYRKTKNPRYRNWGWRIFERLIMHCKTNTGFSGLRDVTMVPPSKDDHMNGFFFSETMKYLYLLMSDDELIDLNKFVFNTEAHPLTIFANS